LLGAFVRVGMLIVFVTILLDILGPPVGFLLVAMKIKRERPAVKEVPRALADYSASISPGRKLSYFGYEFEVPWNAKPVEKLLNKIAFVDLKFESGQNLIFSVPGNEGLLTEVVESPSLQMGYLQPVFGDMVNRSTYEQFEVLLNTTPHSIRAFGPRPEAVRSATLLMIKAIVVAPGLESGVFSFELPDKRGFQIGDPQKSKRVDLEVFDSAGNHIEIVCDSTNPNIRISQPELNRILTSLHAVAVSASPVAFYK
jgi:hypothetical protein